MSDATTCARCRRVVLIQHVNEDGLCVTCVGLTPREDLEVRDIPSQPQSSVDLEWKGDPDGSH